MKLVVVGAGNIGLITALCFAKNKHDVLCVDIDQNKIKLLQDAHTCIYEPHLNTLLTECLLQKKIDFTADYQKASHFADIVFIAVGTPSLASKQADLSAVFSATESILKTSKNKKTFVIKSTVPVGTNKKLTAEYPNANFISCPEFLREGSAIQDCLAPDRIIIGAESDSDFSLIQEIYKDTETNFLLTNPASAELTKYASNVFLASRISLINEFSRICENTGANIDAVATGVGLDHRIGPHFLKAGIGNGGSCFAKDIDALVFENTLNNENLNLVRSIQDINETQVQLFIKKIIDRFSDLIDKTVTIWGAAFKPETNDLREAPSLKIINSLLENNFKIQLFDPVCNEQVSTILIKHPHFKNISFFNNQYAALENSNGLIIATEWSQFSAANLTEVKNKLSSPIIFDGRNIFSNKTMQDLGFDYISIGRPI